MGASTRSWTSLLIGALAVGGAACDADDPVDAGSTQDAGVDAGPPPECAGGDGVCRYSCVDTDPDCEATAGDGVCVGNAGELCTNDADCNSSDDICGNGACSATEDSDLCYADCGPDPWPWTDAEDRLAFAVNQARTEGTSCGGRPVMTRDALIVEDTYLAVARERAWELAHHEHTAAAPGSCNGRALRSILDAGGLGPDATLLLYRDAENGDSASRAVAAWLADPFLCEALMGDGYTRVAVAAALDNDYSFVIIPY